MSRNLQLISGSSNLELAKAISEHLACPLTPCLTEIFSDGEFRIEIKANVRGDDVFVVQSICAPINDNLIQLCLILDALKRASVGRVTAVVPYYGYARQDRKVVPRAPISAKVVADFLTVAGMNRLITVDLHSAQIQGFFDLPVDNLYAMPVFLEHIRHIDGNVVIMSPDAGGTERARAFAKRLNCTLAIIDKRRDEPNKTKAMHVIGDVKGKVAIVVDDMIDTAGTICSAANILLEKYGAREVMACATHPVLSGKAIDRLDASPLSKILITNTIPLQKAIRANMKFEIMSVARLLAKAIHNVHTESSISVLFT